jgi:uncharacterized iron-regulated membrane protein
MAASALQLRTFIAGLAAPVGGAIVATTPYAILTYSTFGTFLDAFTFAMPYFFIVTGLVTWSIGLPLHAYLTSRGERRCMHYVRAALLPGAALGLAAGALLAFIASPDPSDYIEGDPGNLSPDFTDVATILLMFGALGLAVAATTAALAWLIRRPDRDQPISSSPPSNDTSA